MNGNTGERVRFAKMSRADYDSLGEKDGATLYFVNETGDFDPTSLGNTGSDGEIFLGETRLNSEPNVPSDWNATSGASNISNIPSVLNVDIGIPRNAEGGWRKLCDILSDENCLLIIGGIYGNRPSTMAGVAISTNYTSFVMKLLWCSTFNENSRITKLRLVRYAPTATGNEKYKCSLEYYHTGTGSLLERRRFSLFGVGEGFANAATIFSAPLPELASPAQVESELSMMESVSTETACYYGRCETAGATAAKTVTITPSNFKLSTGVKVSVLFTNSNSAASPTLNVNGTGAKNIRRYGTSNAGNASWSSWNAGSVVDLVYDGTYWQMVGYNNTTYSTITQAEITDGNGNGNRVVTPKLLHDNLIGYGCGNGTCETNFEATTSVDGTVEIDDYELRDHGVVAVRFLHAVPSGATLNINSTGKKSIYYRGTAITRGVITDGNIAVFMYDSTNRLFNLIAYEVNDDKYEKNTNKVTSLSSLSTNEQYPTAKCVYDIVGNVEEALDIIINGNSGGGGQPT